MHSGIVGEFFGTAPGFIVLVQCTVSEQEAYMFPGPPVNETAGTPGKIGASAETADIAPGNERPFVRKFPLPPQPEHGVHPTLTALLCTQRTAKFQLRIYICITNAKKKSNL